MQGHQTSEGIPKAHSSGEKSFNVNRSAAGITSEFSSRIVMPNSQSSGEKSFDVNRSAAGINSVTSNQIELTEAHTFLNGESIRIISEDGSLPDGIESNQVYFAITSGISTNIGL